MYRGQVPSPGRPTVAWREDRVRFWTVIAGGVKTEDAAGEAGVSSPVGFRWFRHGGGVNPGLCSTVSGRYLSFGEREEIALFRAQGLGVREIARRLAGARRRSRGNCAATRRRELGASSTRRRSRSGTPSVVPGDRRSSSWWGTSGYAPTWPIGSRGWFEPQMAFLSVRWGQRGRAATSHTVGIPVGAKLEPRADREPPAGRFRR